MAVPARSRAHHGPGIGCVEAACTSVTYGGHNRLWQPLATTENSAHVLHGLKQNGQRIPQREKCDLLNHLPELQLVQFRNSPETEPTHKYWKLIVRISFASQGTCNYGGKYIFSSHFNSWLAEVTDYQVQYLYILRVLNRDIFSCETHHW